MEKKNIIIISVIGVLIILAAAWFIFDPMSSGKSESRAVTQKQQATPAEEQLKEEKKVDTSKKETETVKQTGKSDVYIVKEGDTLQSIAADIYGERKYWFNIFTANEQNIDWYDYIYPGQKLLLPKIN